MKDDLNKEVPLSKIDEQVNDQWCPLASKKEEAKKDMELVEEEKAASSTLYDEDKE